MFSKAVTWCGDRLVGPLAEIASGAYQLVSVVSIISRLGAAVLGLTTGDDAATGATVVVLTVDTVAIPLTFGLLVPLSDEIFTASSSRMTSAR